MTAHWPRLRQQRLPEMQTNVLYSDDIYRMGESTTTLVENYEQWYSPSSLSTLTTSLPPSSVASRWSWNLLVPHKKETPSSKLVKVHLTLRRRRKVGLKVKVVVVSVDFTDAIWRLGHSACTTGWSSCRILRMAWWYPCRCLKVPAHSAYIAWERERKLPSFCCYSKCK